MAKTFGHVSGIPVGATFSARQALHEARGRGPVQAGIWGSGPEGAESVVLSSGYPDDRDQGDVIIYSGQGSKAPETKRHVEDQGLKLGNLPGYLAAPRLGVHMSASDIWKPWEARVQSFGGVEKLIKALFVRWSASGRVFAWRGVPNADWPLHSSLYRRLHWSLNTATPPDEPQLYNAESDVLVELHRWGLHMGEFGRLSVLSQLAMLQHYGAPTRLIDITFNPWIGLWFAVQERWRNGNRASPCDVRLFAIDVTDRLINEQKTRRDWAEDNHRPWPRPAATRSQSASAKAWTSTVLAWKPPHFHPRLSAQNGGFLFGGVPRSGAVQWPKEPGSRDLWGVADIRRATSVCLRVHKLHRSAGRPSAGAVYTFRITAGAVQGIRDRLEDQFGYSCSTLYPDYPGFAQFGSPNLPTSP